MTFIELNYVLVRMCAIGFYTVKKPYSTHSI